MAGTKNGRWTECSFANSAEYNALGSFTLEASLLQGVKIQPFIPMHHFDGNEGVGKSYRVRASGLLGSNGTPTYIFQARLGTVAGPTDLTGASIGVSKAILAANGVTNKPWTLDLDITVFAPGQGAAQSTLSAFGWIKSPEGFASPFEFALEPTTPDTTTWTLTRDATVDLYFNFSVTCSASDAANAVRCKQLKFWSDN